jgi:hypothetical protein
MKIELPNSWQGVTLREFQEVTALLKEAKEKRETLPEKKRDQFDFETECVLISTLSGVSIDDIMQLHRGAHNSLMNQLGFLSSHVDGSLKKRVRVNGNRYYFETNARKITGGQWVSLMHFLEDDEKIDENLHNLLACFANRLEWHEFKGKHNGKIHKDVAADMQALPITTVKPLTDFFLSDWLNYAMNIARFSEYAAKGLKRLAELRLKLSSRNTDGSTR